MTGKHIPIPMRRGITLVELLVVVGILMILVTLVVPGLMPTMESRRVREAARGVNVFVNTVRVRAMDSGKIIGVMLVRDDSLPNACTVLRQVEVPPLYSGDYANTAACLQLAGATSTNFVVRAVVKPGSYCVRRVMIAGGSVRINRQGPWCPIGSITGDPYVSEFTFFVPRNAQTAVPWSASQLSEPLPFEVQRLPEPSATNQFQLPEAVCIDLTLSGMDFSQNGTQAEMQLASFALGSKFPQAANMTPPPPVYILFSPNGSVFAGYTDGLPFFASRPIYLLVGKRERVAAPAAADDPVQNNAQDMNNLWVAINPRSGMITSGEVLDDRTITAPVQRLWASRQIARQGQSIGGR